MSLETIELDKKMLEYSISQFRNIPEYEKMCEALTYGLNTIQKGVNYLSNMLDVDEAEGVWLDYIGSLVGEVRGEYIDTEKYFCVNSEDVNEYKYFYFPNLSTSNGGSSLSDDLFKGQIKAKIAYNHSKGTREDLIKIIKNLVNADHVIINKVYDEITGDLIPMQLSLLLYGTDILTLNIKSRIESILPEGVGIYGEIEYLEISYTDIEKQINYIVDMNYISPLDQDYTYEDINADLNDILEITNE